LLKVPFLILNLKRKKKRKLKRKKQRKKKRNLKRRKLRNLKRKMKMMKTSPKRLKKIH